MAIEHQIESPLAQAVRAANGQSAFARIIKRSQSYVYKLLRDGKPLPAEEAVLVEAAGIGISRQALRPDLFGTPADVAEPDATTNLDPAR
jgi:DNA-binding transcriptional regulator YdaS (Cro superfamily)